MVGFYLPMCFTLLSARFQCSDLCLGEDALRLGGPPFKALQAESFLLKAKERFARCSAESAATGFCELAK